MVSSFLHIRNKYSKVLCTISTEADSINLSGHYISLKSLYKAGFQRFQEVARSLQRKTLRFKARNLKNNLRVEKSRK